MFGVNHLNEFDAPLIHPEFDKYGPLVPLETKERLWIYAYDMAEATGMDPNYCYDLACTLILKIDFTK